MKEFFDKHKDQLSPEEKQALWDSLASRRPRTQGTGQESGTRRHRPRRLLWAYPALGVVATAVLVVVLLHNRNVPGLSQHRPDELVGNAASTPSAQPPAMAAAPQRDQRVPQDLQTKDLGPGPAAGARENEVTSPLPVSATRAVEPRPQSSSGEPAAAPAVAQSLAAAGAGGIAGRVSAASGKPLDFAFVQIDSLAQRVLTDAEGHYQIAGLAPGTYTLTARTFGYQDERVEEIRVPAGGSARADITLQPKPLSTAGDAGLLSGGAAGGLSVPMGSASGAHNLPVQTPPPPSASSAPAAEVGLKAGVVARSDRLHFRG
jgi:hypothetical protein